ncbi:MAG: acetyltransferase [Bacteroidota bacterium]
MENPVIIFGATGLGPAALEIFNSNNVVVYGFLDDDKALHGKEVHNIPVLGSTDDEGFLKLIGKKCEAFIALDENKLRSSLVEMLDEDRHMMPVNAVHKTAYISKDASISHGTYFGPGVLVNTGATIGSHCILNIGATVEYNAKLDDFVQLGAGSIIGSGATVEKNAFIGAGAIIVSGVNIGKGARVGAGSVVVESVPARTTVFGNPAKKV